MNRTQTCGSPSNFDRSTDGDCALMFVRSVITGLGVADGDFYQHMTAKERVEVTEET